MTLTNPHIATQLRHIVYYHLDNNNLDNALFVAGRLFAYEPRSQEASHLLALCHLRLGQYKSAYDYSRTSGAKGLNLGCAYVFAQACLKLGRYQDGIKALERAKGLWAARNSWNRHSESDRLSLPDAAAVFSLLGKLHHGYKDIKKAISCYEAALKHNPFMWDAFVGLCESGVSVKVRNIYRPNPDMLAMLRPTMDNKSNTMNILEEISAPNPLPPQKQPSKTSAISDPFGSGGKGRPESTSMTGHAGLFRKLNESTMTGLHNFASANNSRSRTADPADTPTGQGREQNEDLSSTSDVMTGVEAPPAPLRRPRAAAVISDIQVDVAPKARQPPARPRSRLKTEEADSDAGTARSQSSLNSQSTSVGERKRNISGQTTQPPASRSTDAAGAPQRRSDRLLNQIRPISSKLSAATGSIGTREGRELRKARATGAKGRVGSAASTVGQAISGNRKLPPDSMDVDGKEAQPRPPPQPQPQIPSQSDSAIEYRRLASLDTANQKDALEWILQLFSKLAHGLYHLSHFACEKSMDALSTLPTPQRETPWVLAQMGRAHYEQTNYADAAEYFAKIRAIAPNRLEDMEIYSTVLWHLKADVDLAFLAHELNECDRLSPQTWCALGNSFSLARDHDAAINCFKRATQLAPNFAYALTLQGHEHVANEEYDKATAAYRASMAADPRHYNAWYGLGKVYERQGRHETAESHYRTAAKINPFNAVLVCCIGVVLEKRRESNAALSLYTRATELAPRSAMARFKKARVLLSLQEPVRALDELLVLKDIAPDEANVHYLLGRVYKMLRQKASAIKHFTIALNLDPKSGPYIKQSIESLEDDEEDDMIDDDQMV